MRKTVCIIAGLVLLMGALSAPAIAKKKKAKPITMTYYLHGSQPFGELELNETWQNDNWMKMDAKEPTGTDTKSMNVTNYVGGPNSVCAGNGLLPVWVGALTGRVVGEMKLTVQTAAIPETAVTAVIYPDPNADCNDQASPAAGQAARVVAAGQGTTEITFPHVDFDVVGRFIVQFSIEDLTPGQVRLFYDSATAASSLAFSCIPVVGTSCTPD